MKRSSRALRAPDIVGQQGLCLVEVCQHAGDDVLWFGQASDARFTNAGTSSGGYKLVPDQAIRFDVSPRNLNLGR